MQSSEAIPKEPRTLIPYSILHPDLLRPICLLALSTGGHTHADRDFNSLIHSFSSRAETPLPPKALLQPLSRQLACPRSLASPPHPHPHPLPKTTQ